jgi:hypothetical protein
MLPFEKTVATKATPEFDQPGETGNENDWLLVLRR